MINATDYRKTQWNHNREAKQATAQLAILWAFVEHEFNVDFFNGRGRHTAGGRRWDLGDGSGHLDGGFRRMNLSNAVCAKLPSVFCAAPHGMLKKGRTFAHATRSCACAQTEPAAFQDKALCNGENLLSRSRVAVPSALVRSLIPIWINMVEGVEIASNRVFGRSPRWRRVQCFRQDKHLGKTTDLTFTRSKDHRTDPSACPCTSGTGNETNPEEGKKGNRKKIKKNHEKGNKSSKRRLPHEPTVLSSREPKVHAGNQWDLIGYWEGYAENGAKPYPIQHVPNDVKYIPIAFIAPVPIEGDAHKKATGWEFDRTFAFTPEEIKEGIKEINARNNGQEVFFSLLDTPSTHWNAIDYDGFAENIVKGAREYGVKGFDIDIESGMPGNEFTTAFVNLIKALKKAGPEMKITYVTMGSSYDEDILKETKHLLEYITTMRYWDGQQDLFKQYAAIIGPEKVGIGVKTQETSLDMVRAIAKFSRSQGSELMMLWSLTRDVHGCSGYKDGKWRKEYIHEFQKASVVKASSSSKNYFHRHHKNKTASEQKALTTKLKMWSTSVTSLRSRTYTCHVE
eukprot:jgi/Bigna1/76892/fgenesh1_pg.44_\